MTWLASSGYFSADGGHGAADEGRHLGDFESERVGVFELGDAFLRRVQRDHGGDGHAVGPLAVLLGGEVVEGAADGLADLVVLHVREAEADGGVEHDEVHADLVHALVQESRQHGGGAVERVLGGQGPPGRDRHALGAALVPAHRGPAAADAGVAVALDDVGAADVLEVVEEGGHELDDVGVAVDDWMVKSGADSGGGGFGGGHDRVSS